MQFGRLTGAGLAALGILLLFLQFSFFLNSRTAAQPPPLEPRSHHITAVPGILGGALLLGGIVVFFTGRIESESDPRTREHQSDSQNRLK
jgi:nitrate reductase gamma subunit